MRTCVEKGGFQYPVYKNTDQTDLPNENWTAIEGLRYYLVSSVGRVKSLGRITKGDHGCERQHTGRILKQTLHTDGYPQVVICQDKKQITRKTHRFVAAAFIPNPSNKETVNHKNGIKTDNRVENLEWCTKKENSEHAYATGLNKGKKDGNHNLAISVLDTNTGIKYDCIKNAALAIKICPKKLGSWLRGEHPNKSTIIIL